MGRVTAASTGLSQPSRIAALADGRLHVVAHEWNADSRCWQITQLSANGPCGSWQFCPSTGCA
ncbi:hypothetical protein [Streptomyces zagrosensis]